MKLGALVPAYNEDESIGNVIDEIKSHNIDVVVIDDGSNDNTKEIVNRKEVKLIRNEKNKGLARSVEVGIEYMIENGYTHVVRIDADGQMDTSKIPKFQEIINKNEDIDVISASYNQDTPWMIKKDMRIYSFLYELGTGNKTRDILSSYRIYNRRALCTVKRVIENEGYSSPLTIMDLHRNGLKSVDVYGGVSYKTKLVRPFPIDGLIDIRNSFLRKLAKYETFRAYVVCALSFLVLLVLLIFNLTAGYKYNSILPKKFMRR